MFKKLFIKKSVKSLIKDADQKRNSLSRSLSSLNLITIGIGAVIGAGLFVITGQVAAEYTGPGVIFSFLIAGGISLFAGLCYAEFAALIPVSGSAYSYAYATIGEFPAWILGWGLTLQYLLAACAVSVGWSSYCISLLKDLGVQMPAFLAGAPFSYDVLTGWHATGSFINLPAFLVVGLMGFLLSRGIKAAARVNTILVILKLAVVALFIICGIGFVKFENVSPLIPANTGVFGEMGFSGILRGAGILFFAFLGFDSLSTLSQETKNPQKDMPRGMIGSIGICTIIYLIFSFVLVGLVNYKQLGVADPIAVAVNTLGPKFIWLRFFIKGAILAGLTSVIMVMLLSQTRIFYTMAHDGLLPKKLSTIKDETHVPLFTTILITAIGMGIAGLFPVGVLGPLVSMATLMGFSIVCFGILVLHYTQPKVPRPFSVPFKPWIPLIGAITCLTQMIILPGVTWMQFIAWLFIGCLIYFAYGIKRSHVRLGK
jgi:basic amino acid/polyamine antiporter, APA family